MLLPVSALNFFYYYVKERFHSVPQIHVYVLFQISPYCHSDANPETSSP